MKIVFINTHMPPDYKYGGVVESGSNIFYELSEIAKEVKCICVSSNPEKVVEENLDYNVKCYKSVIQHRYGFAPKYFFFGWRDIKEADFVFVNGTVTYITVLSQILCLLIGVKYAVSVRGALMPWRLKHKKYKKCLYYKLIVLPLLKKACFVHVTSLDEKRAVEMHGIRKICIVPNGVRLKQYDSKGRNKSSGVKFLFLSRTDKEKGIDILMKSFSMLRKECNNKDVVLRIVGPDNQGYFRNNYFPLPDQVEYVDGVYGDDKEGEYLNADIFILPSYSENFGNVIGEALQYGLPVITTTGTPWNKIVEYKCGYYVEPNAEEIFVAMKSFVEMDPDDIVEMGKNAKKLIAGKYMWSERAYCIYENIKESMV